MGGNKPTLGLVAALAVFPFLTFVFVWGGSSLINWLIGVYYGY